MNILVTGGCGYKGSVLIPRLLAKGYKVTSFDTQWFGSFLEPHANLKNIKGDIRDLSDLNFNDYSTIIHFANLAHNNHTKEKIKKVNYNATVQLVKLAKNFNVKKFIFLSTAKINMNYNKNINNEEDISENIKNDFYTLIKYKTEIKIMNILKYSQVNCIILRPALVYGDNVKGNLDKLKILTKLPVPLPFSKANEKKTLCSIKNLIKSIEIILNKNVKSNIFLVCDDNYYSFKEILKNVFKKEKKKLILFPISIYLFELLFNFIRKKNIYNSIFSRMILDNSKIKKEIGIKLIHNLNNTNY